MAAAPTVTKQGYPWPLRRLPSIHTGESMNLKGVLSDDDIQALQARNADRCAAAIQALGHRWLLAPTRGVPTGVSAVPPSSTQPDVLRADCVGHRLQVSPLLTRVA